MRRSESLVTSRRRSSSSDAWRFYRRCIVAACFLCVAMMLELQAAPPSRGGYRPREPVKTIPPQKIDDGLPSDGPVTITDLIARHEREQTLKQSQIYELELTEMTEVLKNDYLAHGRRNDRWDKGMLMVIDETLRLMEIRSGAQQRAPLIRMLRKPGSLKCDDARYYYILAYSESFANNHRVNDALAKGIEIALQNPENHRHLIWLMNLKLSENLKNQKELAKAATARQQARVYFGQWLENEARKFGPTFIYTWIFDAKVLLYPVDITPQEEQSVSELMKIFASLPTLEPWAKLHMQAAAARAWAWGARGHDAARNVPDERLKIWTEKNIQAFRLAKQAHDMNPRQPLSATLLSEILWERVPNGGRLFTSRYWFEQAVAAMVDYRNAYSTYANGLMPRWGGSFREELSFAAECAMTSRYDTPIPSFSMLSLNKIRVDLDQTQPLDTQWAVIIERMINVVFTGYLENEKDPRVRQQLQQTWLNWTYLLDLPEQAAAVHAKLDSPYDSTVAYDDRYELLSMTQYDLNVLLARSKPQGNVLSQAIAAEKYEGDWNTASKLYEQLAAAQNIDPVIAKYAADRLTAHRWQAELDAGQWVDLKVGTSLEGFKPVSGQWERIDENTLQGTNEMLPMRIEPLVNLGEQFEMQLTIDFIHKAPGPVLMAGLVQAFACQPEYSNQYGLFVGQDPSTIWYHWGYLDPFTESQQTFGKKVTITIHYVNNSISMTIDGKLVSPPRHMTFKRFTNTFAIGTGLFRSPGCIVQYSHIKVRKLP